MTVTPRPIVRSAPAIEARHLWAGYGTVTAVADVSIAVPPGGAVAVLGANGAGKSTLLRVLGGQMRPWKGQVTVAGQPTDRDRSWETTRRGVCYIPEGGGVFNELSVGENLNLARGFRARSSMDEVFEIFPVLGQRLSQRAGSLSGGEKRMLAVSRAVLSKPGVLLVDELSLGLAPAVVASLFGVLRRLQASGVAVVLVEQQVSAALDFAQWAWVLVKGRTTFCGDAAELSDSELLEAAYLGHASTATRAVDRGDPGRRSAPVAAASRSGNGSSRRTHPGRSSSRRKGGIS